MDALELYLIAHKVRGEPALDVATQMKCPECAGEGCEECQDGHWWIVPTSGHRAYPWWYERLAALLHLHPHEWEDHLCGPMPYGLPDHYATRAAPKPEKPAFLKNLLRRARPEIDRRGM